MVAKHIFKRKPTFATEEIDLTKSLVSVHENRAQQLFSQVDKKGKPLFTPEDIYAVSNDFARLVRIICVDQNITESYFSARHRAWAELMNFGPGVINHDRNNTRRALNRSVVTKNIFDKFLAILGYCVHDLAVSIITSEKEVTVYKLSDASNLSKYTVNSDPVYPIDVIDLDDVRKTGKVKPVKKAEGIF